MPIHPYDVLVLGEINADLILGDSAAPVFGQAERLLDDATLTIGGSGVIFACGCARLGLRVAYCGVVGDDMFGRFMLDRMKARNVDTVGVGVDAQIKTGLSVILNNSNDRAILTHLGAINRLRAEQVDRALLAATRHVHVTSYFLQHALQPGLPDLLAEAHTTGATVSIDTNWDPDEAWDHGLREVVAQADVFLPNAQEALAIAQLPTIDAAEAHLSSIVPTVTTKLGSEGARCRRGDIVLQDPGFSVRVVDTTGAGDSFDSGFIYAHVHRWPLADALALACACGALSTTARGGTDAQPTLAAAQSLIRLRDAKHPIAPSAL